MSKVVIGEVSLNDLIDASFKHGLSVEAFDGEVVGLAALAKISETKARFYHYEGKKLLSLSVLPFAIIVDEKVSNFVEELKSLRIRPLEEEETSDTPAFVSRQPLLTVQDLVESTFACEDFKVYEGTEQILDCILGESTQPDYVFKGINDTVGGYFALLVNYRRIISNTGKVYDLRRCGFEKIFEIQKKMEKVLRPASSVNGEFVSMTGRGPVYIMVFGHVNWTPFGDSSTVIDKNPDWVRGTGGTVDMLSEIQRNSMKHFDPKALTPDGIAPASLGSVWFNTSAAGEAVRMPNVVVIDDYRRHLRGHTYEATIERWAMSKAAFGVVGVEAFKAKVLNKVKTFLEEVVGANTIEHLSINHDDGILVVGERVVRFAYDQNTKNIVVRDVTEFGVTVVKLDIETARKIVLQEGLKTEADEQVNRVAGGFMSPEDEA